MNVPHAGGLVEGCAEVPFDEYSAGLRALRRDDHVGPFDTIAFIAGLTDLDDCFR